MHEIDGERVVRIQEGGVLISVENYETSKSAPADPITNMGASLLSTKLPFAKPVPDKRKDNPAPKNHSRGWSNSKVRWPGICAVGFCLKSVSTPTLFCPSQRCTCLNSACSKPRISTSV